MSNSNANLAPYPLAMVICDGIWVDPYTGKKTLLGVFSAILGPSFPLVHPILTIYIALTDGHGPVTSKVKLVDADEEREPIFSEEQTMEFSDPRSIVELVFQVTGVQFQHPGEYRLQLFANEEFVIERRIVVVAPTEENEKS
jgi:hypothetical protein